MRNKSDVSQSRNEKEKEEPTVATNMKQKPEMTAVKSFRITCQECGREEQIEAASASVARKAVIASGWQLAADNIHWLCEDDARNEMIENAKKCLERRLKIYHEMEHLLLTIRGMKKEMRRLEKAARRSLDDAEYQGDDISFELVSEDEKFGLSDDDETEEENEL